MAFLSMGLAAAVCVGIGLGLGILADTAWHTAPVFLLIGLGLGLVVAALSVIKQIRTYL
jgi:F0F1-type ATP synthase assembly protein I